MWRVRWWLIAGTVTVVTLLGWGSWRYLARPVIWQSPPARPRGVSEIPSPVVITSDPQYIVMNFAPMNELNWAAPEAEWQAKIRPQVLTSLHALKSNLPSGSTERRLAWSTLMEYMNFPLDTPSSTSAYVIKMRRILEVSEAEDMPVFIPLNGFQWWDELPELYNWWDADGTHTDPRFFARQDNPEDFKRRFIAGYDPDNRYNVEWQDWQTPMGLNWRNWGGGGFRLAPPPNIVESSRKNHRGLSYRQVQRERFQAIVTEIMEHVRKWDAAGKQYLFAGISIGTEVSLNASVTPADEFAPYGYRAMQDLLARSSATATSSSPKLDMLAQQQLRQQTVREYLTQLSWLATHLGVPMQRLYTHVWSEALMGEPRYVDYAAAATNAYARPGISLYGYADKPWSLPVWRRALNQAGLPAWGAVEYSLPKTAPEAAAAIQKTFLSVDPHQGAAKAIVLYNWDEHNNPVNLSALKQALLAPLATADCQLPEIVSAVMDREDTPVEKNHSVQRPRLSWHWVGEAGSTVPKDTHLTALFYPGVRVDDSVQPTITLDLTTADTTFSLPEMKSGVYTWVVEARACDGVVRHSQPQSVVSLPHQQTSIPQWVGWWLEWREAHQSKSK